MIRLLFSIFIASVIAAYISTPSIDTRVYGSQIIASAQDIRAYTTAVNLFVVDHHRLPTPTEGLLALTDPQFPNPNTGSTYIEQQRPDPWQSPYVYNVIDARRSEFEIHSIGPNRIDENGSGDDVISRPNKQACDVNKCRRPSDYVYSSAIAVALISFPVLLFFLLKAALRGIRSRAQKSVS